MVMDDIRPEKGTIPDAIDGQLVELSPADLRARDLFPELFTNVRELKREYPDPSERVALDLYREIKENYRSGFGTDTHSLACLFRRKYGVYWPAEAYRVLAMELLQENLNTLIEEQTQLVEGIEHHLSGGPPEEVTETVQDPEPANLAWILSQNRFNLADFYRRKGDLESALEQISLSLQGIGNPQMVVARLLVKAWLLNAMGRNDEAIDEIAIANSIDANLMKDLANRFAPEYDGLDQLISQRRSP